MQTAKIKIGGLYAVNLNGKQVRFTVHEIKTVSVRSSTKSAATTNQITGVVSEGDMNGTEQERTLTLAPEAIIDDYDKFEALKTKQAQEERAREEARAARDNLRARLRQLLYQITGLPMAKEPAQDVSTSAWYRWRDAEIFTIGYNGVELTDKGVAALVPVLEKYLEK